MSERRATVLIVDRGGRAAALAQAYSKSSEVGQIFVAPGNDLIKYICEEPVETFPQIKTSDVDSLVKLARERNVTLVDVAEDRAIAAGVADTMRALGIQTVGCSKRAGVLESDKVYAKKFMEKVGISTPKFTTFFDDPASYGDYFLKKDGKCFVKAAGLADGKGAFPVKNRSQLLKAIKRAKGLGPELVIEEWVEGEEFSAFYLGDGKLFLEVGFAQDHKLVFDNDQGENTGGMGAVSPTNLIDDVLRQRVQNEFVDLTQKGLEESAIPFKGILYLGGMFNPQTLKLWLLEYNTRWGDPEAQVIVPALDEDFFALNYEASRVGGFCHVPLCREVLTDGITRISVAATALGYPENYSHVWGREIVGLKQVIEREDVTVFGAAVAEEDGKFYVAKNAGGRLFHLMAEGISVEDARAKIAAEMSRIYIPGDGLGQNLLHSRRDIGLRELQRSNTYTPEVYID